MEHHPWANCQASLWHSYSTCMYMLSTSVGTFTRLSASVVTIPSLLYVLDLVLIKHPMGKSTLECYSLVAFGVSMSSHNQPVIQQLGQVPTAYSFSFIATEYYASSISVQGVCALNVYWIVKEWLLDCSKWQQSKSCSEKRALNLYHLLSLVMRTGLRK